MVCTLGVKVLHMFLPSQFERIFLWHCIIILLRSERLHYANNFQTPGVLRPECYTLQFKNIPCQWESAEYQTKKYIPKQNVFDGVRLKSLKCRYIYRICLLKFFESRVVVAPRRCNIYLLKVYLNIILLRSTHQYYSTIIWFNVK